ncbi:MAG: ERAP1-like C-terminal domain-containing protein, partial [bacterium]|nr:ERAP1-like C-terminal domain-containing protein [bacterium]
GIIGDLKIFFEPKSKEKQQFRDFIKELVAEQYNRLGIEALPDDTLNDTKLRPTIMALMLYANDERYLDAIEEKYASQEFNTINPDFRWTVGAALVRRNPNLSLDYFNIYKQSVDPELKGDLADAMLSVMDHDILLSYLSELRDGVIRPQDRLSFFVRLLRNYRLTSESLDWMYENWKWLLKEEGEKSIGAYPRYSAMLIKHKSDADKYHEFFDKYLNNPIVAREIKVGYSDIAARMRLIERDTPAIYKYLGEQYI